MIRHNELFYYFRDPPKMGQLKTVNKMSLIVLTEIVTVLCFCYEKKKKQSSFLL